MTLLPLVILALGEPTPEAPSPFGHTRAAHVQSIDPDANRHRGDGAYGRFDGDLDLGLGAGPSTAFTAEDFGVAVRGTAFWYSTIGLDLLYAEALSNHPSLERRFGVSAALRPLFLIRWSKALEAGPAVLDLALDSLSLGVGASFGQLPGRDFGSRTAFEASLGFGVPLAGTAPGPWLEFRAGLGLPRPTAGDASALLVFSYHFALLTPIVKNE